MQRSDNNGCDMRKFRSFSHSACKTVLNLIRMIYLSVRKTVVQRVTVVKFGAESADSKGSVVAEV